MIPVKLILNSVVFFPSRIKKSAERQGFEPWIPFWSIHTFQACAFDHSAISPCVDITTGKFLFLFRRKNCEKK